MLDNVPRGTICIEDIEMGMTRHLQKGRDRPRHRDVRRGLDRPQPGASRRRLRAETIFEGRIAHGMLTAGLISAVIGEQLPGHGTVYMGQSLKFLGPVRPGDMVEAQVEVVGIDHAKRRVQLDCRCSWREEGADRRGHRARPVEQVRLSGRLIGSGEAAGAAA